MDRKLNLSRARLSTLKKMLNIVGWHLNPPENEMVPCIEEKTQIQASDRTWPKLLRRDENPSELTATLIEMYCC